jgi:hypothetical protein
MELSIEILHRLPNRIRLRFSNPVKQFNKLKSQVMEHEGIESYAYNSITKTALVEFDAKTVNLQEILIRTAVVFSVENDLSPVRVFQQPDNEFITPKGLVAGLVMLSSGLTYLMAKNNAVVKTMEWLSVVTTSTAVLEHAAYDYRKKGSVDPEVFSLIFLVNSIISGRNLILPSALTWVTTFGRHFSTKDSEGILLEINKNIKNPKKALYEINVSKLNPRGNFVDFLNLFAENFLSSAVGFKNTIFENSKELIQLHDEQLEGIGEKINGIILNFKQ